MQPSYLRTFLGFALLLPLSYAGTRFLAEEKKPSLIFADTINLGVAECLSTLTFDIPVTNRGKKPILLTSFATSCKCAVLNHGEVLLKPGQTHQLTGSVHTPSYQGRFEQSIAFKTTDDLLPIGKIKLVANVADSIKLVPARLLFEPGTPVGTTKEVSIKLTEMSVAPLMSIEAVSPVPFIRAEAVRSNNDSAVLRLTLTVEPPSGEIDVPIKVNYTAAGKSRRLLYTVGGLLRSESSSSPGIIVLGGQSEGTLRVFPENLLSACDLEFTEPSLAKMIWVDVKGDVIHYHYNSTLGRDPSQPGSLALIDRATKSYKLLVPIYFTPRKQK
jgi:hypothetical protein